MRKLDSRVRARFHLSLAEVGAQNDWQRAVLGFALVGSDRVSVERSSAEIARFIERTGLAELVRDEHEVMAYGDGPMGDDGVIRGDRITDDITDDIADLEAEDPMAAEWIPESWKAEDGGAEDGVDDR